MNSEYEYEIEDLAASEVGRIYWLMTEAQRLIYDAMGERVDQRKGDYGTAEIEALLVMQEVLDEQI